MAAAKEKGTDWTTIAIGAGAAVVAAAGAYYIYRTLTSDSGSATGDGVDAFGNANAKKLFTDDVTWFLKTSIRTPLQEAVAAAMEESSGTGQGVAVVGPSGCGKTVAVSAAAMQLESKYGLIISLKAPTEAELMMSARNELTDFCKAVDPNWVDFTVTPPCEYWTVAQRNTACENAGREMLTLIAGNADQLTERTLLIFDDVSAESFLVLEPLLAQCKCDYVVVFNPSARIVPEGNAAKYFSHTLDGGSSALGLGGGVGGRLAPCQGLRTTDLWYVDVGERVFGLREGNAGPYEAEANSHESAVNSVRTYLSALETRIPGVNCFHVLTGLAALGKEGAHLPTSLLLHLVTDDVAYSVYSTGVLDMVSETEMCVSRAGARVVAEAGTTAESDAAVADVFERVEKFTWTHEEPGHALMLLNYINADGETIAATHNHAHLWAYLSDTTLTPYDGGKTLKVAGDVLTQFVERVREGNRSAAAEALSAHARLCLNHGDPFTARTVGLQAEEAVDAVTADTEGDVVNEQKARVYSTLLGACTWAGYSSVAIEYTRKLKATGHVFTFEERLWKASAYMEKNDHKAAMKHYAKAASLAPDNSVTKAITLTLAAAAGVSVGPTDVVKGHFASAKQALSDSVAAMGGQVSHDVLYAQARLAGADATFILSDYDDRDIQGLPQLFDSATVAYKLACGDYESEAGCTLPPLSLAQLLAEGATALLMMQNSDGAAALIETALKVAHTASGRTSREPRLIPIYITICSNVMGITDGGVRARKFEAMHRRLKRVQTEVWGEEPSRAGIMLHTLRGLYQFQTQSFDEALESVDKGLEIAEQAYKVQDHPDILELYQLKVLILTNTDPQLAFVTLNEALQLFDIPHCRISVDKKVILCIMMVQIALPMGNAPAAREAAVMGIAAAEGVPRQAGHRAELQQLIAMIDERMSQAS